MLPPWRQQIRICPALPKAQQQDAHQLEGEVVLDDEVRDLKGVTVRGEPVIGTAVITLDERGQGARPAIPLPSPKEPTQAAREIHNLTHVPYAD